jgi:hypothetical protein
VPGGEHVLKHHHGGLGINGHNASNRTYIKFFTYVKIKPSGCSTKQQTKSEVGGD